MFRYIIEDKEMTETLSLLNRFFKIRIGFFKIPGYDQSRVDFTPEARFCQVWQKKNSQMEQCSNCNLYHVEIAKELKELHIYRCHNGLIENILPVYDRKGIYLESMIYGQFRDSESKPEKPLSPELKKLYDQIPLTSMEQMQDIGKLLKLVSDSIIDQELIRYRNKPWAETLENYIEAHLHEKITTEQLATAINRSTSFVAHHFDTEFGQAPRQYILKRRMEEAKLMLENGGSVQKTAGRLGFYDAFHFSKTFKRFWGKAPSTCLPV
jgi:AraC-like DNA-binding protein/ligand-binding sensor protein